MPKLLTEEQVSELKRKHKELRDKRLADRIKAVLMLHFGFSYSQINQALLLDELTLRRYVERYLSTGLEGLIQTHYRGGQTTLTSIAETELREYLRENTKRTAKEVADYVAQTYAVKFSVIGITKLLHRVGFVYKKPKIIPGKADRIRQAEFLKRYEEIKTSLKESDRIYFIDSTHPTHNTRPAYGWILKGKANDKLVKTNSGRDRLNFNGALNFEEKTALVLEEKTVDKEAVLRLLQAIKARQQKGKVYLILDNASHHHAGVVRNWILNHPRFKLVFIPAYSPNLNLIERLWKFFHAKVTWNHYFETFEEFKSATLEFFKDLKRYQAELATLLTDNFQLLPP